MLSQRFLCGLCVSAVKLTGISLRETQRSQAATKKILPHESTVRALHPARGAMFIDQRTTTSCTPLGVPCFATAEALSQDQLTLHS